MTEALWHMSNPVVSSLVYVNIYNITTMLRFNEIFQGKILWFMIIIIIIYPFIS